MKNTIEIDDIQPSFVYLSGRFGAAITHEGAKKHISKDVTFDSKDAALDYSDRLIEKARVDFEGACDPEQVRQGEIDSFLGIVCAVGFFALAIILCIASAILNTEGTWIGYSLLTAAIVSISLCFPLFQIHEQGLKRSKPMINLNNESKIFLWKSHWEKA